MGTVVRYGPEENILKFLDGRGVIAFLNLKFLVKNNHFVN